MSFEAGSIYYTIEAKTGALLTADKQVSSFNKRAQEGFERTAASMSKLTTIAKAVSAALVSSQIISYAQSWNELEDRIQNTGATASQTKDILDQLLATSDRNGRTIEESSELYIRLSNSMQELGYSTQGTLSYIDTLSNLMTINKTNSLSAESAINALTKAQMKGKLAGVEAMAVFNAMPSILKTLGKQLNKTEAEVRKMASDGKLSMRQFTDAMIAAQDETAALADNMRNTVNDGINRVTNNLKKYFGELNNSTGATKVLVDSLILMSRHVDILMTGVGALAAIYAGKYITSLASATKQSVEQTIAKIRQAQAEKAAAQAALQQAQAELANARAAQQSLAAQLKLAQTETTRNAIRKQLKASTEALTAATAKQTAAQARLDAAMKATSFAAKGLRSAMALLGGPAGILILAAGALMTWSSKANEAKQKAMDLTPNIDALTESFKQMNKEQREAEKIRLSREIQEQITQIKKQEKAIKDLKKSTSNQNVKYGFSLNGDAKKVNEDIITLNGGLADMKVKLENLQQQMQQYQVVEDKATKSGENLSKNWDDASKSEIDKKLSSISKELDIATLKSKGNSEAAFVLDGLYSALGNRADEYKDDLMALALGQANFTKLTNDQVAALQPLVAQLKALSVENNKIKSSNKKGTTKSYAEEVKELSDKLAVAKLEAQGLTVEAELLAVTQKMGGKATAEQTEKLKELIETSQAYKNLGSLKSPIEVEEDSFKQSKKSLDVLLKEGEIKTQEEYNSKLEELEKQHQINMAKIKSDAVVSKIDDAVAQVDPVQALKNEHDRKLALIQEFENQKWLTEENALALREAANHQYEQNRINAQWEIWRNQSDANEFLASSLEGLASSATSTISGLASGTMTATQAMQNFANVILNEAIGSLVQMGMQYVKNAIVAQTTSASTTAAQIIEAQALAAAYEPAAMNASIATEGAAAAIGAEAYATAIGSMKALGIAGARKNGGPVDAGSMYRVGEGGKPEILVAGGKQYLIPGENGRVLSNCQITSGKGGSSVNLTVNMPINIGDSGGMSEQDGQQLAKNIEQAIRAQIMKEQRPGGLLNRR
jgi:tape measure domain-containing protein